MQFLDEFLDTIRGMVVSLIKQNEPTFCYGVVTAVNPIKVKVKDSYEVDEAFLILDSRCRHTVVKVPVDGGEKHIHKISTALNDTQGVTAVGPVTFVPAGVDIPTDPNTGLPDMDAVAELGGGTVLTLNHDHGGQTHPALPEILLWRGLKVGDNVKILRLTGGSIHYVMERVERLDNPGEADDSGTVKPKDDEENWP